MKEFYTDGVKMVDMVENSEYSLTTLFNMMETSSWTKYRDDANPDMLTLMEEFEAKVKELFDTKRKLSKTWDTLSDLLEEMETMGLEDEWLEPGDIRE